jgi:AraC family transcriptional regulator
VLATKVVISERMKRSATGRILVWRGGSLWIGLAGEPTSFHTHHAVQITLPFPGGRARFRRSSGNWKSYAAAIVGADERHAFDARGQLVAQIFVEPESREGRALQRRYSDDGIAALPAGMLLPERAALSAAYEGRATDAELMALARAAISRIAGAGAASKELPDTRIDRALVLMRERVSEPIPLRAMAAAVHLSPDRFRHLFMQETGVTFRAYLLWLRLECSLAAYVAGRTLTEAAYAGGFADSAHLSRTFKRMFGIAPASVRPE